GRTGWKRRPVQPRIREEGVASDRFRGKREGSPCTTPAPRPSATMPPVRNRARDGDRRMLVIGVAGMELTAQEREWLQNDACAGVILFKRNFSSRSQVMDLCAAIRAAAPRPVLICVDQEGGRVQRFREGFS